MFIPLLPSYMFPGAGRVSFPESFRIACHERLVYFAIHLKIPLRLFFFFPLIQFCEIVSELRVIIKTDVLNSRSTPKMNYADEN